ncbi:bile acid:sodium symporter family protein [Alkalicoccobacillus plakortidis]|uniref:Bile acid:sodium symporter family protein n=1 Tax=Alkalicoccobacillus plakortidis TaxID=444060 RepID=A0ABT0XLW7_9BACI|nr:bile acid:sodium symporter family protein [Alkalicoccobacillus plakortidis]MCM2676909.1 bile acid:sodium symporter family protein [Alkalicoccobacillus plakortidis]
MHAVERAGQLISKYFALIVILVSVIAFVSPGGFTWIQPHITFLLGIIMFGMGLTMKASDFAIVAKKPIPVLIGVVAQFVLMPCIAFGLTQLFNLPYELAVGIILVGACPGGTASNVMVFLAKGDLPLSVAMTSISTLLAPIMTPTIMFVLASQWVNVDTGAMFMSIVKVILIPIALGILLRRFLPAVVDKSVPALPLVSILAILAIVTAVVSANKDNLATTAFLLFLVVLLHNTFGLLLGYVTAWVFKLDESKKRAVSIEVGMQNSGLGASLASDYFEPITALPSAIFSVVHNITGPIMVSIWSKRPTNK